MLASNRTVRNMYSSLATHLDHAQLTLGQICKLDLLYRNRLTITPVESLVH